MNQQWSFLTELVGSLILDHPENLMVLKFQLLEILVTSGNSTKAIETLNKITFLIE